MGEVHDNIENKRGRMKMQKLCTSNNNIFLLPVYDSNWNNNNWMYSVYKVGLSSGVHVFVCLCVRMQRPRARPRVEPLMERSHVCYVPFDTQQHLWPSLPQKQNLSLQRVRLWEDTGSQLSTDMSFTFPSSFNSVHFILKYINCKIFYRYKFCHW